MNSKITEKNKEKYRESAAKQIYKLENRIVESLTQRIIVQILI